MLEVWTATAGIVDGYFKGYVKDTNNIEFDHYEAQNCYIRNSLKFDESSLQIIIENKEPFLIGNFCFDLKTIYYIFRFDCSFKRPITVKVKDLEDIVNYNIIKDMITIRNYNIIEKNIEGIELFELASFYWFINEDVDDGIDYELDSYNNPQLINTLMKYATQLLENDISDLPKDDPYAKEIEDLLKKYPYTDIDEAEFREKYSKYLKDLDEIHLYDSYINIIPGFEKAIVEDIFDNAKFQCECFKEDKGITNVILTIDWQNETLDTSNADPVVLYRKPEIIY